MCISQLLRRVLIIGLLGMALPVTAHAAKQYLVEMVVFTQPAGLADLGEEWRATDEPLDAGRLSRAELIGDELQVLGSDAGSVAGKLPSLPDSGFTNLAKRISADGRRRILLRRSWIQPVLAPSSTPIARLTEAVNLGSQPTAGNGARASYGFSLSSAEQTGQQASLMPPRIDGFAMFAVDNYYALELDLRYTPTPAEPNLAAPEEDLPRSYRIHEKRRMKSGEPNYYDHPQFGVLLLVTPVEDNNATSR
jgi:hypothetical protein